MTVVTGNALCPVTVIPEPCHRSILAMVVAALAKVGVVAAGK